MLVYRVFVYHDIKENYIQDFDRLDLAKEFARKQDRADIFIKIFEYEKGKVKWNEKKLD